MAEVRQHRKVYATAAWQQLRMLRLTSEPLCRLCMLAGHVAPAVEVDHIEPISKGGDALDYDNTQSLCHTCHSRKTAQDEGGTVKWGCRADGIPADPNHHWHGPRC